MKMVGYVINVKNYVIANHVVYFLEIMKNKNLTIIIKKL